MCITFTGKIDALRRLVELAKTMPDVRFAERPGNIFSLSADFEGGEGGEGDKPSLERVNQLREARSLPPLAAL